MLDWLLFAVSTSSATNDNVDIFKQCYVSKWPITASGKWRCRSVGWRVFLQAVSDTGLNYSITILLRWQKP